VRSDPAIINSSSEGDRDIVFRSPKALDHAAASAALRLLVNHGRRIKEGRPLRMFRMMNWWSVLDCGGQKTIHLELGM
jgi:hypothetical protein